MSRNSELRGGVYPKYQVVVNSSSRRTVLRHLFFMPIKHPQLVNGEIYHVIIRGVGDSLIFKDDSDHYRGIFSIYEFNNSKSVEIKERKWKRHIVETTGERFSDT